MDVLTEIENAPAQAAGAMWGAAKRIAFRFCFVYFGLYCFAALLPGGLPIPGVEIPDPFTLWPFRQVVFWVAAHLFGASLPLVYAGSGSGDKTYDWVEVLCLLIVALVSTTIWTLADRKRRDYPGLSKWFQLYIRFSLAMTILIYGFDKVVPVQMPYPSLRAQMQPLSAFSPAGILWNSIGASPAYEIFAGVAEIAGGVLLMFPQTVTLGALVCLLDMIQVWMLNMTYDVPVKQYSFHLLLMSLFLLAPHIRRLWDFFVLNCAAEPEVRPALFRSARANRIASWAQVAFWIWVLGLYSYQSAASWNNYGGGRQKSALYGIWDVTEMKIDGQIRPALLSDNERWRRLIFDFPTVVTAQHLDDSFENLSASLDAAKNSLSLTRESDKTWKADMRFARAGNNLKLWGMLAGRPTEMQLQRVDESKFLLKSRGFHWVQEYPVIR
jgi:uncharacterized membrane protein YphA (DoxX/SURF4 family)